MNVLYSTSDSYAYITGISIYSLLENNSHIKELKIFIMDNKISESNKEKINSIIRKFNREVIYINLPDIESIVNKKINTRRWNISTFGRLFMASCLPAEVEYILNIDCDTIINGNIEEIFELGKNFTFSGVSECINYRYKRNIKKDKNSYYFNGGLVFLNLKKIRENGVENKFIDYIKIYGDSLAYLDQDVINSVIPESEKYELPLKYDVLSIYYYTTYKQLKIIRKCSRFYSKEEFQMAKNNPIIIHYTSCFLDGLRPWYKGNKHPLKELFLSYKNKTPWKNEELLEDKRNKKDKIIQIIINIIPKFILCRVAGILHGIYAPNKYYKNMKRVEKHGTN